MVTGGNNASLLITLRMRDEASAELKSFGQTLEENQSQLEGMGFGLAAAGAGLGVLLFLAARAADTQGQMAAKTEELKKELNDLAVTVGEVLLPVFLTFLEAAVAALAIINAFPKPLIQIGAVMASIATVALLVAGSFFLIASTVIKILPALRSFFATMAGLRVLLAGPAGVSIALQALVIAGIAAAGIAAITAFRHGGIVTRPTVGLLGEAGPEAIIPLDSARGGLLGGTVNVTLNVDMMTGDEASARRVSRKVLEIIREDLRTRTGGTLV